MDNFSRMHLWNVVNPLPVPDLNVIGASGSQLQMADGTCCLDFWGDEGVASLGYNSDIMRQAINDFLDTGLPHRLPQVYNSATRSALAEKLCSELGYDRVFFANSGTEANEAAIKLARLFHHKSGRANKMGILTLPNNFHGTTGLAMASCDSTDSPRRKEGFGPMAAGFGVLDLDETDPRRWEVRWHPGTDGYGDGDVGAVICAPILGNNCVKVYPPGYLQALREWCDERGALLIYDEVQSGCGRTGHRAAFQHPMVGVKPDIISLGKGIALGFPMTATLAMEHVASVMEPGCHYSSFAGGDFICHMAMALQSWLDVNQNSIHRRGKQITAAMERMPWIKQVDGIGLMRAFTPDFANNGYDGPQFCAQAAKNGLLLATFRRYGAIRFNPPLNVRGSELNEAFEILEATHLALAK